MINRATRLVTVDRAAEMGDTVVIDFEGFKDGVAFDGGKAEGYQPGAGLRLLHPRLRGADGGHEGRRGEGPST